MVEILGAGEAPESTPAVRHEALEGNASLNEGMDALNQQKAAMEEQIQKESRNFIDTLIEESIDKEIDHAIEVGGINGKFEYDSHRGIDYNGEGIGFDEKTIIFNASFLRKVRDAKIIDVDIVSNNNPGKTLYHEAQYVIGKLNARMDQRRNEMETNKSAEISRIANIIIGNWENHEEYLRITDSGKLFGMIDAKIPPSIQEAMNQYGITESDIITLIAPEALKRREIRMAQQDADFAGENDTELTGLNDIDVTTLESNIRIAGDETITILNPKLQEMKDLVANVNFSSNRYNDIYTAHPELVEAIQSMLGVQETGVYDPETFEAVKAFQNEMKDAGVQMVADGLAGPTTLEIMIEDKIPATKTGNPNNQMASLGGGFNPANDITHLAP